MLRPKPLSYYYAIKQAQRKPKEDALTSLVRRLFSENRGTYGTRKLKALLLREGTVSRDDGLVESWVDLRYTVAKYKPQKHRVTRR